MRTIDEYMKLPYKMEILPDMEEGGNADHEKSCKEHGMDAEVF